MQLIFPLLQQTAIIVAIAYLFSKSPIMRFFTGGRLTAKDKIVLYLVFTAFSILGTYFGLPVKGAIANTRAIGAVLAGLIGGPLLGTAVGLSAGIHRFSLGGFTAFSCGVSTVFEGLLGGLVHLYFVRRNKSEQIYSPLVTFATTFCAELGQMAIILILARPFHEALELVKVIALPMITANAVGATLFMSMVRDQKRTKDRVGALFSAKALDVAGRTLDILSQGFNRQTSAELAEVLRKETGVGMVAITDREKILAITGMGDDHHIPGNPIMSPLTKRAIRENNVVFADGKKESFHCPLDENCPLGSVLIVPLRIDREVVGTIELFEPKDKLFLKINRTFGEGLTALYSHQLLRLRYEEQKTDLIRSELKLIHAQVNPHFLFNTLNTITAVVRKDADRARQLLISLSSFLRTNLKRSRDVVSLDEELDHIGDYLEIEKARFADRLKVDIAIDDDLRSLQIPVFTLQPLIENAIKHGIANVLEGGCVCVEAFRDGDIARIVVEDNAGAFVENETEQGLGMNLVDKRLKNLFGPAYGVQVECIPAEYTRVIVSLPIGAGGQS